MWQAKVRKCAGVKVREQQGSRRAEWCARACVRKSDSERGGEYVCLQT